MFNVGDTVITKGFGRAASRATVIGAVPDNGGCIAVLTNNQYARWLEGECELAPVRYWIGDIQWEEVSERVAQAGDWYMAQGYPLFCYIGQTDNTHTIIEPISIKHD